MEMVSFNHINLQVNIILSYIKPVRSWLKLITF